MINQNKVILYKEIANAPKNPFEAAKKAYLKTKHANELLALVKETDESAATREESVKSRTVAEGTLSWLWSPVLWIYIQPNWCSPRFLECCSSLFKGQQRGRGTRFSQVGGKKSTSWTYCIPGWCSSGLQALSETNATSDSSTIITMDEQTSICKRNLRKLIQHPLEGGWVSPFSSALEEDDNGVISLKGILLNSTSSTVEDVTICLWQ